VTANDRQGTRPAPRDAGPEATLTAKGEGTRARILGTALDLFRERGYEHTTMRLVAEDAGVSLGNAYYYFKSKEHIIQAFYARIHEDHLEACEPLLATKRALGDRLLAVVRTKLETAEPYHRFSATLFKTAADPHSPLSPFSPESAPVRREATELMARVVEGSRTKVPRDLGAELPNLLWLYMMGIILFWIHDDSPGRRRSHRLAERTAYIVAKLTQMASLAVMNPLRRAALKLVRELREEEEPPKERPVTRPRDFS